MNTRPYTLPTELPDPPQPPAGTRWVYRGKGWSNNNDIASFTCTVSNGGSEWSRVVIHNARPGGVAYMHYLESVTLRPVPESLSPVPEGFEYFQQGGFLPIDAPSSLDIASFDATYSHGWLHECSGYSNTGRIHYALRIGSLIHHLNFDVPPPDEGQAVTPNPEPVTPVSGEAREFWLDLQNGAEISWSNLYDCDSPTKPRVHVREVLPGEVTLREQAVEHLRAVIESDSMDHNKVFEASQWLEKNFPEPEFNYANLWRELPSWYTRMAMNDNYDWWAHSLPPVPAAYSWESMGFSYRIPPQFCPPPAPNWRTSLLERPTLAN